MTESLGDGEEKKQVYEIRYRGKIKKTKPMTASEWEVYKKEHDVDEF